MAETVTIAGKKIPKPVLYVAGAGTVGFVGYAWWTRGRDDFAAEQAAIDESLPGPIAEPTDEPGFGLTGTTPPKTNAEWNNTAVQNLQNLGIDAVAAQAAIGKFLQRRSLTLAEASLVEQAIASAGYPPENGPWVILRDVIPGPITPAPGLPGPTGVRAQFLRWNGNTPIYRILWNAVSGAKDYHIVHVGGGNAFTANTHFDNQGSAPGRVDTWEVASRDVANKLSGYTRVAFTAASKTGAVAGKPGAPGFVNITKTGRSTYDINFVPPAGATSFRYRRISGGTGSAWATASTSVIIKSGQYKGIAKIRARALFSRRTTFTVGVIACNSKGCGPEARSRNSITLP